MKMISLIHLQIQEVIAVRQIRKQERCEMTREEVLEKARTREAVSK